MKQWDVILMLRKGWALRDATGHDDIITGQPTLCVHTSALAPSPLPLQVYKLCSEVISRTINS